MFKLITDIKFTHRVPVMVPMGEGYDEQSLKVTYQVIGDDRLATFNTSDTEQMKAMLRVIVFAMDDVADADGQPMTYSDELREQLIDLPYVRMALVKGYYRGVYSSTLGN